MSTVQESHQRPRWKVPGHYSQGPVAWFDIFIEFLEAKSTKAVALNWSLGDRGGRKLTVGKQWSCESVGYQGPHGAHVHGSIGVDSVPTLHVLHLCGVHVLHLQREASASHRGDWAGNRGKPGKSRGTPAPMTTHPPLPPPAMPRGSTALGLCCIVNMPSMLWHFSLALASLWGGSSVVLSWDPTAWLFCALRGVPRERTRGKPEPSRSGTSVGGLRPQTAGTAPDHSQCGGSFWVLCWHLFALLLQS